MFFDKKINQPYGFTGRPKEVLTGLYYYRYRDYDPQTGRFLQPDPLGQIPGPNIYSYCFNNPINWVDPWGLLNILAGAGGSVVAITGVEASTGTLINPGLGTSNVDYGIFGSLGTGTGINVSGDLFIGVTKGSANDVSGLTINGNFVIGPVGVTIFTNPNTGEISGGTIGVGPGIPFGISGTASTTGKITIGDIIKFIKDFIETKEQSTKK